MKRLLFLLLALTLLLAVPAAAAGSLSDAQTAINDAIGELDITEETTLEDLLEAARSAVDSSIEVLADEDFYVINPATDRADGILSVHIFLFRGDDELDFNVIRVLPATNQKPPATAEEQAAADADWSAACKALDELSFTNALTKDEMFAAAKAAATAGSTLTLAGFDKTNATFDAAGTIAIGIYFDCGNGHRELQLRREIPQLQRKMPDQYIALNREEWETIRLTNVERFKAGSYPVTATQALQYAAEQRAAENVTNTQPAHTRPDGSSCFTAIPSAQPYTTAGENMYVCAVDVTAARAMDGWMHSESHRKNLLNASFQYMGAGMYEKQALQMFTGYGATVTAVDTSAHTFHFANEDAMQVEYLLVKDSAGITSFLPLDTNYMTETETGYKLTLRGGYAVNFTLDSATEPVSFEDVSERDWFYAPVLWAVENEITLGTTTTTFSPKRTCSRAQIITFLWRTAGEPEASSTLNWFVDVKSGDYFHKAALWAREAGLVDWGQFFPEDYCTRGYAMYYIWVACGSPAPKAKSAFTDVTDHVFYSDAVAWAVENGVTSGTSATTFDPDKTCDRSEIVTFLYRARDFLK